jgi:hypothetical protein
MVVARLLGFETGELKFKIPHAGAELTLDLKLPDMGAIIAFIERRLVVLYAGVLAESLRGGKVNNERALQLIRGPEGSDDYSKARELIRVLAGVTRGGRDYQSVLDELDSRFWNRAASLAEKYATQIDVISKHWRAMLGGRSEIVISPAETYNIPAFREMEPGLEIDET